MLLIPREGNLLRLYVQLSDADVIDPETGRADKARASPEKVLEMAQRILRPYKMKPIGDHIRWWTIYVGESRVLQVSRNMSDAGSLWRQWVSVWPTNTRYRIAFSSREMRVTRTLQRLVSPSPTSVTLVILCPL